jgi:phospholipid/cholesterol/gamma-HCH transport system ATP-binding protein
MKQKIIIENLSKSFKDVSVLINVNLTIQDGESLAVIGGSGCGKSVLIKCISGLFKSDPGSCIMIDDFECSQLLVANRPDRIREKIGMLFQSNALFDSMSVSENITFGLSNKISKSGFLTAAQRSFLDKTAKANLEVVGLATSNLEKYPYELSGGMQKRVAIARLITTKPEIILLDEPTTGLDPVTSYNISQLILEVKKMTSATIVTISHDPICVTELADRIALIDNKTVAWTGIKGELDTAKSPYIDAFRRATKLSQ